MDGVLKEVSTYLKIDDTTEAIHNFRFIRNSVIWIRFFPIQFSMSSSKLEKEVHIEYPTTTISKKNVCKNVYKYLVRLI